MQHLQIELLNGFGRHEPHGRALHRLGDGFRVAEVVLLSLGNGRTYLAGISRGSWPSAVSLRLR